MKIAKTPLESIRIKWTIYGILTAAILQGSIAVINFFLGRPVDGQDVIPSIGAVFAIIFAVHGATYSAARTQKK